MRTVEMDDQKRASPITHVIRGRSALVVTDHGGPTAVLLRFGKCGY